MHTMEGPKAQALASFKANFGGEPDVISYAPGRVNLIGEHTDYNDGFVLPFALPFRTYVVGSVVKGTNKSTFITCTLAEGSQASFEISDKLGKGTPSWANYVKGTIFQYLKDLPPGIAFNAVIASDVPIGSGLSSSASLEVAVATFLEQAVGLSSISKVEKALRCQKAEHTFADTPCGIMDQYVSAMGQVNNLLLIDCRSNEYKLVPVKGDANAPVILVTNSNVKHTLSGSEYPDRVRQCKEAVASIKKRYPAIKALRDCTMEMLNAVKSSIPAVNYNRARHCIKEDERTQKAVEALQAGDYVSVGKFMTESHRSLQHDYEVSCAELDQLVDLALEVDGVYGSRMTGGGFGGCTVTLVKKSSVAALKEHLKKNYPLCECYEAVPSAGAGADSGSSLQAAAAWLPTAAAIGAGALAIAIAVHLLRSRK